MVCPMSSPTPAPAPAEPPTAATVAELPPQLSREQAAWMLQISPRVLDEAARREDVPSMRFGRGRRYSKAALLEFIANGHK
jgi:hypothetical protein